MGHARQLELAFEDTPRFVRYVRAATERYAALAPLARLFDVLENRAVQVGYSF